MSRLTPASARRRRAGVTLAELLVAMFLLSIIGTALTRLMMKQQQSYRDLNASLGARRELGLGATILPTELRSISSAGGDILAMNDSAVTVLSAIGVSIVCDRSASGGSAIWVPPINLAKNTLTSYVDIPGPGDIAFLYNDSLSKGAEDDEWTKRTIRDADYNTTKCPGAPFTDPTLDPPGSKPRRVYVFNAPLPDSVRVGAGVRFARPVRYQIYQETSGNWYLGMQQFKGGGWQAMSPLAGPFRPYQSGDVKPSGLQFRYFDTLGVRITDYSQTTRVGRIDMYLRTNAGTAAVTERKGAALADSVVMRVAIRNSK